VVVVINTGLRFGANPDTLAQADPNVATTLETGQIVFGVFLVIQSGQLRIVLREWLGALAGGYKGFVNSRVAETSGHGARDSRPVTEPVAPVTEFRGLQTRLELDALRVCPLGERIRAPRQVHAHRADTE